jgi:dephospho-CoA kinase
MGAGFIDADEIVDYLYRPCGDGYRKIETFFGPGFIKKDGLINRSKLAKFVFGNKHKLNILNNLIHPLVFNEIKKRLDKIKNEIVAIEASYFKKKSLGGLVDIILWIECPFSLLKKRALIHRKFGAKFLDNLLEIQEKPRKVDYEIDNNASKRDFYLKLKKFFAKIAKDRD